MKLLGFNFNKICAEKKPANPEKLKININTKIDISEITSGKADFFKLKEEILGVRFVYVIDYEPDLAKIELEGNMILAVDSKMAKEALKDWEDKKISEDLKIKLFNIILNKSSLKALQLEEELTLPAHMPFPSVKKQDSDQN